MANRTGDPRGPGMPGSGGWDNVTDDSRDTVILGPNRDVDLEFDEYTPQIGRYVAADDLLQVQLVGLIGNTFLINYRILRPDGQVLVTQETFALPSSRTQNFITRQLTEGILLSVVITPNGSVSQNVYCFATVSLRRQNLPLTASHEVLCSGYVTLLSPLTWPGSVIQRPTDGAGILRSITGSTPAAGAEISEVVPANTRWELLSLKFALTTSVAVANRQSGIILDDGANIFYQVGAPATIPASTAANYSMTEGQPAYNDNGGRLLLPLPVNTFLGAGFRIRTNTLALQAADQNSAPQYLVREWQDSI